MFLLQVPFACKEHESVGIDEKTCLFGNEEYHFRFESFLHKVRFRSVDPNHQECTNRMERKKHCIQQFLCDVYIQNFHRENRSLVHIFLIQPDV